MNDFRELGIQIGEIAWFIPFVVFLIWCLFKLRRLIRWWRYYDNGYSVKTAWYLSGGLR